VKVAVFYPCFFSAPPDFCICMCLFLVVIHLCTSEYAVGTLFNIISSRKEPDLNVKLSLWFNLFYFY